ncbi:DUF2786 domain-containing protein [Aeromicrobium sp. S22]|uniref:DUF2786 domain-containing protein n=1 Tax=Aeromicrobium sp. S22 TaxID=2662029 RepID=UPI00129D72C4|nr:DUF2786 domain-containing protein [Aeromicrobium sp. S22]MRK01949.1 DUF2786 domain-containing protein [Aeromicrobium sp. S22]
MGSSSRQRRDARRRVVGRSTAPDDVEALIDVACRFAVAAPSAARPRIAVLNELSATATDRADDPAALVVDDVLARIAGAWEHGWQPADLVHVVHRRGSKGAARWVTRAVLVEARRCPTREAAPPAWTDQLRTLEQRAGSRHEPADLLPSGGGASVEQWLDALVTLDLLRVLPTSQLLMPPPSRWSRSSPAASASPRPTEQRTKMLSKVRSLLAKAESTEFAAEAEAFTAKAQDLMTRHSIDEALLAADVGESFDVGGVRVLIDQPYALEKATLLHVVAEANRVRAVWNDFSACVTLIGLSADVEQVDLLFTSLLVQATRSMTQVHVSGAAFRRAFLHAFAVRIGERLTTATHEAEASYGQALVPVLERQAEAVSAHVDRLFPHLTTGSRRRQLDARGWDAGTRAADAAVLPAGAVESH